ncbi:lipoate--protein ligase family protein [Pseudomonas sp. RIT-PI-S]|uniref:lipoyl protein ligase domain-containing protein n=1 Tax=Pseudomonas sp. RIT-PI-S TaxID=3035295 RepID=UPI0021D9FF1C|nr:lipoate--protein ligase family protein [Pseudomonas sp. RIT-PI-S]
MDQLRQLTTEQGLQAELALLTAVCNGERTDGVLFWQPTDQALVMPRRMERLPGFVAGAAAAAELGWPVLLRETGGEPVPQSAATVNVALVYAAPRAEGDLNRLERAYLRLCEPLCWVLESLGGQASLGEVPGAFCDGRYNVNLDGRKWVGTAQRWRQSRHHGGPVVLVHGAMLMQDQRLAMVAAVNGFNQACGLPQRCLAESHVAFEERFPGEAALSALQDSLEGELVKVRALH